ncbi:hypothetical protein [Saccharopolyspora gregorii]|uniref:DUF732 domain-containing protein n=1 Tax=Saccharopolyspora gregorii TaxID=33914 RepID=A0ABP6RXZ5_9PSEU
MRAGRQLMVAAALALPVLAGCGQLQEGRDRLDQAQQGLDKATACVDALEAAGYTPNLADVEQAQDDARTKADEISALAQRVGDRTLQDRLLDVQASLDQVATGQITLQNGLNWSQQHLEKTAAVADTCADVTG